ncbi:MAG: hypothetical protein ABJN69_02455 [Hellea sp.]
MNIRLLSFAGVGLCAAALSLYSLAGAQEAEILPKDLGLREAGQSYPFKLIAKNVNCDTPQDFEFILDNLPWLKTPSTPIVKQLGPGESRTIQAKLDFKYTPVGIHYGRLTSTCLTCGWDIFASCEENGQDIVLKVNVQDPSQPNAKRPKDKNPYIGIRSSQPMNVTVGPQISDKDVKVLEGKIRSSGDSSEQRRALANLQDKRSGVKAAAAAGQKAQSDLRIAQREKSECERLLLKLKSEADDAARARTIAEQDAKNRAAMEKAAKEAAKSYEDDLDKADRMQKEAFGVNVIHKGEATRMEVRYGEGSPKHKRALKIAAKYEAKYNAKWDAFQALKKAKGQVPKTYAQARLNTLAARKKADEARAAETLAKAAYDAQTKICKGKADAIITAQTALDDAKKDAIKAVKEVNAAEIKAAQVTLKTLDEQIKARRKHCETKREAHEETMKNLVRALKAGQKLTILQNTGKAKPASIQAVNAKIWNAAENMAKDKAQIVTIDPAEINTKETAETVLNNITGIMGNAASALQDAVGSTLGTTDFHQAELLGGLKALAYTAQSLVAANRNPNSNWRLRDEMLRDTDSYWYQQMRAKKIGKNDTDRKELMKHIDEIQKNPDYIQNTLRASAKDAAQCLADIQTLKDQKAALEKKFKK